MINRLINWAKKRPYDHLAGYMNRWWILPYADSKGSYRPAIRIHEILRSDLGRDFHDHPWDYVSIILRGGYYEVIPQYDKYRNYVGDKRTWYGPGSIVFRCAEHLHRLELPEGQTCTTLFTTFKYKQKWGFIPDPHTGIKIPHDVYDATKDYKGHGG